MAFNTLLFDLDGTLSDPLVGIARSFNFALEFYGFNPRNEADLSVYIGPPLEESLGDLIGSSDTALIASMVAKYRERYLDVGFKENTLYPEIRESLELLKQHGQRLAVCTSKPERTARMVLQLFDLQHFFEFVSGGGIGVRKWMQIEALLTAGGIDRNALMIGDRGVDLQAAHKNGIAAGAVLWGHGSRSELQANSPEYWFNSPLDWSSLLD